MFLSAVSASVVNIFLRLRLFLAGDIELNPGPRNADYLTIKDLRVVQHALWNGRSKWYNIGIQLEVSIETLDVIRSKYSNNADECLTELLAHWLRQATHPPTWSLIISVLKSRTINLLQMASEIEKDRLETEKSSRLAEEQKTTLERNLQEKDRKLESLQKTVAELTLQNREQMTKHERKIQEKNSELEAQKKIVAELKVQKSEQKTKLERIIQEKNCELESQKRIVPELKVQKIEQRDPATIKQKETETGDLYAVADKSKKKSTKKKEKSEDELAGMYSVPDKSKSKKGQLTYADIDIGVGSGRPVHPVPQTEYATVVNDPNTIQHEQEADGDLYAFADKPKKDKSEDELAGMYSVPDKKKKSQHEQEASGDHYAFADKPKKDKSEDELAGMYCVPDKKKKSQLTYADIDIGVGSGKSVSQGPQTEYATVVN